MFDEEPKKTDRRTFVKAMVVAGAAMAVVYATVLWVTRNPELRAFGDPLVRRLRRTR